jgi:hypothetical protein
MTIECEIERCLHATAMILLNFPIKLSTSNSTSIQETQIFDQTFYSSSFFAGVVNVIILYYPLFDAFHPYSPSLSREGGNFIHAELCFVKFNKSFGV